MKRSFILMVLIIGIIFISCNLKKNDKIVKVFSPSPKFAGKKYYGIRKTL